MRSYLKNSEEHLKHIFVPGQFAKYYHELPEKERRNPYRNFENSVFKCASYSFQINDGGVDCITLDDFTGQDTSWVYGSQLEINFNCVNDVIGVEFSKILGDFIKDEAHNFLLNIELRLNNLPTNFQVGHFFKQQLEQLYHSITELRYLNQDESLHDVQKELIDLYIKSYESTESILKDKYDFAFAALFISGPKKEIIGDVKTVNKTVADNGLLLNSTYRITPRIAQRLKGWLMEGGYIGKGTRSDSLQNIFQATPQPLSTKIVWTGANKDLKYFVNLLHKKEIITESRYQGKWQDVVNSFEKDNGSHFESFQFSKNTDMPSAKNKEVLDQIVFRLSSDLTG